MDQMEPPDSSTRATPITDVSVEQRSNPMVAQKNFDKTSHIDYTFVSRSEAIEFVTMGSRADWIAHTHHSP